MHQKRVSHFGGFFAKVICVTTASENNCGTTAAAISTWTSDSHRRVRSDTHVVGTAPRDRQSQPLAEPMNSTYNFKTAFCARFEYPQENFEQRVFWNAMHPEAKPLAWLIRWLRPNFFASDLDCIRSIATAESKGEVRAIINSLQYDPSFKKGFFRGSLRIRISGRRLTRLAARVLGGER
jgi:hypothetical protein